MKTKLTAEQKDKLKRSIKEKKEAINGKKPINK